MRSPKFSCVHWSFDVSMSALSLVVLITTHPELSRFSEMLQHSVLQKTWNREHQLPQVFSVPLTKLDGQSESSMKVVCVLESVVQFLRQPRLWSTLVLRIQLNPFSKILVCLLCHHTSMDWTLGAVTTVTTVTMNL